MLRFHDNEFFDRSELNKRANKLVGWIYIALGIGLTARLLGIQPSKFSVAGVELSVANTNVIPGFFFLVSLMLTIGAFWYALFFGFHIKTSNRSLLRIIIYRVVREKRMVRGKVVEVHTLRGRDPRVVKKVAQAFFKLYMSSQALLFVFPTFFILIFEHASVLDAIKRLIS